MATATASTARPSRSYEIGLLLILTLANGVVGLDRLTASYLAPYLVADLHLSNTQVGLLASSLSLAVALSSFALGHVADATGRRKLILILATLAFSIGSALGGVASGFAFLLVTRFAVGFAEGPMVPVSQAVLADQSDPKRRGFNMGFMQMTGAFLLGAMAGPVIVTQIASAFGWRAAFFLSIVPGLLLAALILFYVREAAPAQRSRGETPAMAGALAALLRIRNIRLIVAVAVLFSAWLMVQNAFLAIYLTQVKGLAPTTAGWVLSMGGIAGVVGGTAFPALSDRLGRKTVLVTGCFAGLIAPIALILLPSAPVALGIAILIGWLPLGIAPLYCGVVPAESVSPALMTSAIGLSMGTAELFGGVAAPYLGGLVADAWGLEAILYLCIAFAIAAGLVSLFLTETAPAKVGTKTHI